MAGSKEKQTDDGKVSSLGRLHEWRWPWPPWGNWDGDAARWGRARVPSRFDSLFRHPVKMSGGPWEILPETWARTGPKRDMPALWQGKAEGPATGGTAESTMAHRLCRPITRALWEVERRKKEMSLFIVSSSVLFKFLTMRRHLCISYIIIYIYIYKQFQQQQQQRIWEREKAQKYRSGKSSTHG